MQQNLDSLPPVLTMGFSPAAAVATWRLAQSGAFKCYTYWPTDAVTFQSEVFGADQVYKPFPFDLSDSKQLATLPGKAFAVVILVVPTIKDVVRMCRRIQPALSKQTLILVDVSGGIAPVQRLVKTNLGSAYQVSGMICDIDAEFSVQGDRWVVLHRKLGKSPSGTSGVGSNVITLEPSAAFAKIMSSLEAALTAAGLTSTHTKTSGVFGEIQWQRTIGVVVFEVLTVALDIPEPEKLAKSLIAKPIAEGLVGELTMVAAASGIKGLPSKSQLVSRGPNLARRAPNTFKNNRASRVYYDVYRKASIALDFLVLLPILLSDELPKGGATPYLESLYAFMSRLLDINSGAYVSELFQHISGASGSASSASATKEVDPAILADLDSRTKTLESRENDIKARESRYQQVLEELRVQQQQHTERVAQFDNQWAQNERRLQSFEELNARAEQLRHREEQMNEAERKSAQRERSYKQRELGLINREQALLSREQELLAQGSSAPNGGVAMTPNGAAMGGSGNGGGTPPQMSPQVPMTPGGTVYSRFDPRAPPIALQPSTSSQQQQSSQPSQQQSLPGGPPFYGIPASSSASIMSNSRPRQQHQSGPPQMMSRTGSRTQIASPQTMQAPYFGGPGGPGGIPQQPQMGPASNGRSRRPSRKMSMNEDVDMMAMTGSRRRQQSMPNNVYGAGNTQSQLFSQNFQLDGVMGSATDRYHFVSRARNKQKDVKLSSDEDAYQASRKFLHGGGAHASSPSTGFDASVVDSPGGGFLPTSASRSFHPADLSATSNISGMTPSRRSMNNIHTASSSNPVLEQPRALLSTNIVPNGGPDFSGFNFGENMDGAVANGGSSGSTGSQNLSSNGSNGTPNRSRSGTPPTPQGTIDPTVLNNNQKWNHNTQTAVPFNLT